MAKQRFRKVKQGKTFSPSSEEIQSDQTTLPHASVWIKMRAFLTDTFMLMMPIMYIVIYFVIGSLQAFSQHRLLGWFYIFVALVVIQTLFMGISGQTPGYRAYGLKLISIYTHKKPSWGIVLFRNLTAILSALTIIGWLMMYFRKANKTLHDLLSGTTIIATS